MSDLLTTPSTRHSDRQFRPTSIHPLEMGCKIDPRLTASRPKRLSYRVLTKRRSGVGIWGWIDRAGEGEIEKIDR